MLTRALSLPFPLSLSLCFCQTEVRRIVLLHVSPFHFFFFFAWCGLVYVKVSIFFHCRELSIEMLHFVFFFCLGSRTAYRLITNNWAEKKIEITKTVRQKIKSKQRSEGERLGMGKKWNYLWNTCVQPNICQMRMYNNFFSGITN